MVGTGTAVSFKYCEYVVRELSATTPSTVFLPPTPDFKIFLPQSARELQALMQWRNLLLHPLQKIARGAVTTSPGDDRLLSYVVPSRLDVHYVSAL